jgi:hypothetical protein
MNAIVLGMHRSGTSAATRVISLLGISLCRPQDLLRSHDGNASGHWEPAPLVSANDSLLRAVSARWWCPPDNAAQVAALADEPDRVSEARTQLASYFPVEPWVWKDPRLCLTLPYWRRVMPRVPAVIWMLRNPVEIAESLLSRDRIARRFALAIWERYMTLSAEAVDGLAVWMTTYAELVDDPVEWAREAAAFLEGAGMSATLPRDLSVIRAFINTGHMVTSLRDDELTCTQKKLWDALSKKEPSEVPAADPATCALMSEVRAAFALQQPTPRPVGGTFVSSGGVHVLVAQPPPSRHRAAQISVLLFPDGRPALLSDADALRPFLPSDSEIVTVSASGDGGEHREHMDAPEWFVPVRRDASLSLAQRVNVAAEVARGDILIILAGPRVTPIRGWLPFLRRALRLPDCAVAAPALYPEDGGEPAFGLELSPVLTDTDWVVRPSFGEAPFTIAAASIAAFATRRDAFSAVRGFDDGLIGAGGEDVDYCLRLWRAGWRCVAVPRAQMRMTFRTLPAESVDVAVNTMRIGAVHLSEAAVAELTTYLARMPCFAEALSRVVAAGVGRRRQVVASMSWYDLDDLGRISGRRPTASLIGDAEKRWDSR